MRSQTCWRTCELPAALGLPGLVPRGVTCLGSHSQSVTLVTGRKSLTMTIEIGNVPDMSETYTKLFSSITDSTIWYEPNPTRIVWITMLAMADRHGYVGASLPGLAGRARVTLEEAEAAINSFLSPDKHSRSQEFEGRRIEVADRGWTLLNYERFRDMRDEEARKEYERKRKREQRAKSKLSQNVPNCPAVSAQAEAEAEAEAEARPKRGGASPKAQRLPAMELPNEWLEFAIGEGLPAPAVSRIWKDFCDYWRAAPGSRGVKLDWLATWRRWVRKEVDGGKHQSGRRESAAERVDRANPYTPDPEIDRYL